MMIIKIPRDKVEIFEIVSIKQEFDECESTDDLYNVKDAKVKSESNLDDPCENIDDIESNRDIPNGANKELHNQITETSFHSSTNSDETHLLQHVTKEHTSDQSDVDTKLTLQNKYIFETVSVKKELGGGFSNDILCEVKHSNTTSFSFERKINVLEKEVLNNSNELVQRLEVVKPNFVHSRSKVHVNNTVNGNTTTAEFQSNNKLSQNITKEHKSKSSTSSLSSEIFKCLFCPKVCTHYASMLKHTRSRHPSSSCYRCLFCKNSCFSSVTNLATHSQTVHSQSTHACTTCWKVYTSLICLKAHMKICQSSSRGRAQINCEICDKTLSSKETFEIHLRGHMGVGYPCTECDETFLHYKTMTRHRILKHGNGFKCKFCYKVFSDKADRNRHICILHFGNTSTEKHNKPFCCDLCDKKFSRKDHMRDHIRYNHMKEGFKCSQCSRSFATDFGLTRHKIQHSKDKTKVLSKVKYCCDLCSKIYSDKRLLRDHLNEHYNL